MILGVAGLGTGDKHSGAATDPGQQQGELIFAPSDRAASSADIEAAIDALSEPVDYNQVNAIILNFAYLTDQAEKDRLQALLDARMQRSRHILTGAGATSAPDLAARVEGLILGLRATVQDLRTRDALVAEIARLADPVKRAALRERLNAREQEAETTIQTKPDQPAL